VATSTMPPGVSRMWESVRLMIFKGVSCSGGDGHDNRKCGDPGPPRHWICAAHSL